MRRSPTIVHKDCPYKHKQNPIISKWYEAWNWSTCLLIGITGIFILGIAQYENGVVTLCVGAIAFLSLFHQHWFVAWKDKESIFQLIKIYCIKAYSADKQIKALQRKRFLNEEVDEESINSLEREKKKNDDFIDKKITGIKS